MYIHYSIGNNSGRQILVRIVEVSVKGGVHFRRFHCIAKDGPGWAWPVKFMSRSTLSLHALLCKCILATLYSRMAKKEMLFSARR